MKEHPHADVLRDIADGVPMGEFEIHYKLWGTNSWDVLDGFHWIVYPKEWDIRRKQQYITVNGFKVPKPLTKMPLEGLIYIPHLESVTFCFDYFYDDKRAIRSLERGIAHATKEGAIAHAKAILGIDPEIK